jgi:hypothetical protein
MDIAHPFELKSLLSQLAHKHVRLNGAISTALRIDCKSKINQFFAAFSALLIANQMPETGPLIIRRQPLAGTLRTRSPKTGGKVEMPPLESLGIPLP